MYVIEYRETPGSSPVYLGRQSTFDLQGGFQSSLDKAWHYASATDAARTMMQRAVSMPKVNIDKYVIRVVKPVQQPQYELAEVA